MTTRFEEPVHFANSVTFGKDVTLPEGAIKDSMVSAGASIQATKLNQRNRGPFYQGAETDTVVDAKQVVYVVTATGKLREFKVGVVTACTGNATITVVLQKNGVNVANSQVVLDNTGVGGTLVTAPISVTDVVAGDRLSISVTVSAGTGVLGKGLFGFVCLDEAAQ